MGEFFRKIKEKLFPEPDFDLEDDELAKDPAFEKKDEDIAEEQGDEEIEVAEVESSDGPEIASKRGNKMVVIAASSLLITLVIYFLFVKDSGKSKDKLEAVAPVKIIPKEVARSEDGRSPFEIDDIADNDVDEISLLEKPSAPNIPELPNIPEDLKSDKAALDDLFMAPEVKKEKEDIQKIADLPSEPLPEDGGIPLVKPSASGARSVAGSGAGNGAAVSDPRYAPIIVLKGATGPSGPSVGYDDNIKVLNGDPILSLKKSEVGVEASFVEDRSNVVAQGKIINAVLETAINTEAPGSVRAIISRDIYGEAGDKVLIPRGSRLYGGYSTDTTRGQARVQINWTRLIRPDGVDLKISSFASDQFGRAGIEGVVDNKYSQVIGTSLLAGLLTVAGVAGAEALVGDPANANTTTTVDPTNGTSTVTGRASTQVAYDVSRNITDTASKFLNDYFDSRPTITVPQGTRITVLVNADIKAPPIKR